jgi:hypothetical protein
MMNSLNLAQPVMRLLAGAALLIAAAGPVPAHAQGAFMDQIARGTFEVKMQPLTFEGVDAQTRLGRVMIDKQIAGDLVATTQGQMLSAMTEVKGSATYVAIEHVAGTLHGKRGTFVLHHSGVMNRGAPSHSVLVVPDSGTGELAGIEGTFKIDIEDGKHLYEFAYRLPAAK